MLTRIQRQSNMIVRNDQTKWVVQKFADEGSQSPFMARLLMGIMRLRDVVFTDPAKRDKFDKSYEFVIASLMNARATSEEIIQLWEEHARKVSSGEVARLQGRTLLRNCRSISVSCSRSLTSLTRGSLPSRPWTPSWQNICGKPAPGPNVC
jgi:hypothetical protein